MIYTLICFIFNIFNSEGSASESEDDNERNDVAEEETDDDDNVFFDTRDILSSSSFKSNGSDYRVSSFSSDNDAFESEDDVDSSNRYIGTNHPHVKRRKKLPDPVEKEKGVSLWSMIKDNIGKDLTKVCLPVYFNEPLSSLQKCFEEMEYSYLLDQAYEWGKRVSQIWLTDLFSSAILRKIWALQYYLRKLFDKMLRDVDFFYLLALTMQYWCALPFFNQLELLCRVITS